MARPTTRRPGSRVSRTASQSAPSKKSRTNRPVAAGSRAAAPASRKNGASALTTARKKAVRTGQKAAPSPAAAPRLTFHPLTPDRWRDVTTLFGPKGACAGCWCMWWRLAAPEFRQGRGEGNRRALRKVVGGNLPPGVLAYAGGETVGWCAIAPREAYPRLDRSRIFQPIDEEPVWSVSCFFVARPYRRRGVTVALLEAALAFARSRGARIVEGYPVEPRGGTLADPFAWTGFASTFRAAGFREAARRSATRPMMRIQLG